MDFVYPVDFAGEKSGKFKLAPLAGTIAKRREFARINAEAVRKSKVMVETVKDMAIRVEQSCDENQAYAVACAQCIADRAGFTADEIALLDSGWDSPFWAIQPIEEVEAVIQIFRGRNNI